MLNSDSHIENDIALHKRANLFFTEKISGKYPAISVFYYVADSR